LVYCVLRYVEDENGDSEYHQETPSMKEVIESFKMREASFISLTMAESDRTHTLKWWEDFIRELSEDGVLASTRTCVIDEFGQTLFDEFVDTVCKIIPTLALIRSISKVFLRLNYVESANIKRRRGSELSLGTTMTIVMGSLLVAVLLNAIIVSIVIPIIKEKRLGNLSVQNDERYWESISVEIEVGEGREEMFLFRASEECQNPQIAKVY